MINYRWILGGLALIAVLASPSHAAEQKVTDVYRSVKSDNCSLKLSVPETLVGHISTLAPETVPADDDLVFTRISPVCQFDVDDDSLYNRTTPIRLTMSYKEDKGYRPRIYYWDGSKKRWTSLPSVMNRTAKTVQADIHLPYARVAIFVEEKGMHEGVASWYADKRYPEGAATDLYPVGTRLKVTNLTNGKTTVVVTTSTWNNTDKRRVIDLVKGPFAKIADLDAGLARVRIEKLF